MRIIIVVLVLLLVLLQYQLWIDPSGLQQVWRLKEHIAELSIQNHQIEQSNAILEADVEDLKQGHQAIEERARNDLGMVKNGETFYQIVN